MGFMPTTLEKTIFHKYFSKILAWSSEELHLKIDVYSSSTFTDHHSKIVSKAKYETAIHSSATCFP